MFLQKFIASYDAPVRHSAFRLYETVTEIINKLVLKNARDYPRDYAQLSSVSGKLRLAAMQLLLPHHRIVYSMFEVARAWAKVFRKS